MARTPQRRQIEDVRVIAALAHPVRVKILGYLLANGARTATDCAAVAGASPSACSYHLRHLERFGLVERADADEPEQGSGRERGRRERDGRERRWRITATGFSFGGRPSRAEPAAVAARLAQTAASVDESARLAHRYLREADRQPGEWQDAATFATYGLRLAPAELDELRAQIDALIRPYIALTREDAPADAREVHATLHVFRRTER